VNLKRENDCFADEVAIDFPSVAHLVARVRRSFLADATGDRGETVRTEICLSSGEANRGVVVPVTEWICPDCEYFEEADEERS